MQLGLTEHYEVWHLRVAHRPACIQDTPTLESATAYIESMPPSWQLEIVRIKTERTLLAKQTGEGE